MFLVQAMGHTLRTTYRTNEEELTQGSATQTQKLYFPSERSEMKVSTVESVVLAGAESWSVSREWLGQQGEYPQGERRQCDRSWSAWFKNKRHGQGPGGYPGSQLWGAGERQRWHSDRTWPHSPQGLITISPKQGLLLPVNMWSSSGLLEENFYI